MNHHSQSGERQQPRNYTPNERISKGQMLTEVLAALDARREELSAVLPPDISFASFHATINQALRANPELLTCTPYSLINACVKAAYDGCRVDGVEAAIVWEMATVREPGKPDRKEKQARYMSMYQGMVQQLLRGRMVLACEADVIYANDEYDITRGSAPIIHHRPRLVDAEGKPLTAGARGPMVAVYNVATLPSGYRATAYLTAEQVIDIAKESRSGWDSKNDCFKGIWKRWPREQWKKTVLRQHRKTLPRGRDVVIRDMDAAEDFPQFDRATPHPQFAAPPRPTRSTAPALGHDQNSFGTPLDLGKEREGELVEQSAADHGESQSQRQEKRAPDSAHAEPSIELPADGAEWVMWQGEVSRDIRAAADAAAVNATWQRHQAVLEHAPEALADDLRGLMTDRLVDIATGGADGRSDHR